MVHQNNYKVNLILIIVALCLLLTACTNSSTPGVTTPTPLAALAPTTLPLAATALPKYSPNLFGTTELTASLTGGGSTRIAATFEQWLAQYKKQAPNIKINFESTNSGNGLTAFQGTPLPLTTAGIKPTAPLDFAGSDVPFNGTQLVGLKGKGELIHLPVLVGAVVVIYHLDNFQGELKLSGSNLAKIFLGQIKDWSDPAITSDNGGIALPAKPITVAIRNRTSTGSGTSEIFSRYLALISPEVRDKVGAGSQLNWPQFGQLEGADGTAVANLVSNKDGAIGYVDQEVADAKNLSYASLRNYNGNYTRPIPRTLTSAAQGISVPDDFRTFIIDPHGSEAYPLVGFSWLIVWKDFANMPGATLEKAQGLAYFLWWGLHSGQQRENLPKSFGALPSGLVERLESRFINSDPSKVFQFNGQPLLTEIK
ncbi:MAG: phosphate ABC transporter substrate-binding protein PstS [Chloroflexi bacterium]|nr:phosphate ABC transporter substrate-binding protein PstS [Chloroflexota bacterium]